MVTENDTMFDFICCEDDDYDDDDVDDGDVENVHFNDDYDYLPLDGSWRFTILIQLPCLFSGLIKFLL